MLRRPVEGEVTECGRPQLDHRLVHLVQGLLALVRHLVSQFTHLLLEGVEVGLDLLEHLLELLACRRRLRTISENSPDMLSTLSHNAILTLQGRLAVHSDLFLVSIG